MKTDYRAIVHSQSSREGANVTGIVLHTTEGSDHPGDLLNLANYFQTVDASSHIANNIHGQEVRMVPDRAKAWTSVDFNRATLNLEQIGFSSYGKRTWMVSRHRQLKATATRIAYWSSKYGIPIERGKVSGSVITKPGIFQHRDLGIAGGGHSDCGDGYPMRYILLLARLIQLEHFKGRPGSKDAKRLRRKVNRIRKRYNLAPFAKPYES